MAATSKFCRILRSRSTAKVITRKASASSHETGDLVTTERVGQVRVIGINRPEHRNAVDPATARALYAAFREFEGDEKSLVAVLHGHGGCFCAGWDLKALSTAGNEAESKMIPSPQETEYGFLGPSRMVFSKPVIAAVAGYAVAGGLELALMCDLRVVEENAVMGVFCRRFGVPLVDGGTVRLPGLIGLSRAMDLILTGRPVKGDEALQMGLANRVVKTGTALGQALLLANSLLKYPQECMRADRRSAYYSTYDAASFQEALQYEYTNGIKVIESESVPGAKNFADGVGRHGSFSPNKGSKL